ncbi:MAG: DNA polymerase I [Gemmatimonadales bacterium]
MAGRRERLFLVDGYALIYRAFFAMIGRPLTTSHGENTSATWGVANFLFRLFEEQKPEYVAWVHDAGSSFRTDYYPEYKATREKLDDELQEDFDRSVARIEDLLGAFSVRLVSVDGYEADDVIGTLAERAHSRLDVVIVSGDKDFYQLVSPHVSLLNPGRRGPAAVDEQLVTTENAHERLGVQPEQVVDFLALVGDSSDNVPGVRGIGPKTAQKLIESYGSLESILENAANVSGKRAREALLVEAENALLSRKLVTIKRDVPVELDLDELRAASPDWEELHRLFGELEFHSLIQKLPKPDHTEPRAPHSIVASVDEIDDSLIQRLPKSDRTELRAPYSIVASVDEIDNAIKAARAAEFIALSVHTSGSVPIRGELVGLSLSVGEGETWYLPFAHGVQGELVDLGSYKNLPPPKSPELSGLAELLGDPAVPKAGHDLKNDLLALRKAGIQLRGMAYDSMLVGFLLDPGRRSQAIEVTAAEYLNHKVQGLGDLLGSGRRARTFPEVPIEDAARFSAARSEAVLKLKSELQDRIATRSVERLLSEVELPLLGVLADMEWLGITLDLEALAALSQSFGTELQRLETAIYEAAGTEFNVSSTPQLRHVLFEKLQLPVIKKTKTGPSTDAEVLDQLAEMGFELPTLLLEYRELSKLKSTYADALPESVNPETGRIHTSFNQVGTTTGRLSSFNPNLQNIPVRTPRGELIRECFVPASGCLFVVADYSQVELRLLAHLSNDALLIEAFRRGGDVHRETASIIFEVATGDVTPEMRDRAKTINFATIYGQGPFALSRQLDISRDEARDFIERYFERFSGVREFLDAQVERAKKDGFVETICSRRRYIPELKSSNHNIRAFGERTAMNSPIQGSAADLIKVAMVNLDRELAAEHLEANLLLQVHDELVLEVTHGCEDKVADIVKREMEGAIALSVPLVARVGCGSNWLSAKK